MIRTSGTPTTLTMSLRTAVMQAVCIALMAMAVIGLLAGSARAQRQSVGAERTTLVPPDGRLLPTHTKEALTPVASYGKYVLFAGYPIGQKNRMHIVLGNLTNWHPRSLYVEKREQIFLSNLAMSKKWITWIASGENQWAVYAMRRGGHRPVIIDSSSKEGEAPTAYDGPWLALDSSTLVWRYSICTGICAKTGAGATAALAIEKLGGGKRRVVARTHGSCDLLAPWIAGHLIAWQELNCSGQRTDDVFLKALPNGRTRRLTNDHMGQWPAIEGHYVAWTRHNPYSAATSIVVRNLATGRQIVASRVVGRWNKVCRRGRVDICVNGGPIVMTDGMVIWQTGGTHEPYLTLVGRNLATGKEQVLVHTNVHWSNLGPGVVAGKHLVWNWCYQRSENSVNCTHHLGTLALP